MRYLYMTVGIPGSGKSTYLRELRDNGFVISSDELRGLISPKMMGQIMPDGLVPVHFSSNGGRRKSDAVSKEAFRLLEELVTDRLDAGITTIVDSTLCNTRTFSEWVKKAKKLNARLVLVDFPMDVEEAKQRVLVRDRGSFNPQVIETMSEGRLRVLERAKELGVKVINKDELYNSFAVDVYDFNSYKAVTIVGDVHSNYEGMKQILDGVDLTSEALVMLGDYIDRGVDAYKVINKLHELSVLKNVYLLKGNHDVGIGQIGEYLKDGLFDLGEVSKLSTNVIRRPAKDTLVQICTMFLIEGYSQSTIKEFARRCRVLHRKLKLSLSFNYGGYNYICTHAGVDGGMLNSGNLKLASEEQLTFGVEAYKYDIDSYYRNAMSRLVDSGGDGFVQIHGHQNIFDGDNYLDFSSSINLDIKEDDSLLTIRYCKLGVGDIYKAGSVVASPEVSVSLLGDVSKFVKFAESTPDIMVRDDNATGIKDVRSYNFTRDVFYNEKWYDEVMVARGLFINVETNEIVARGYDKFFNIGEFPEVSVEALIDSMVSPITVAVKENGYLGVVGYDRVSDSLGVFTKTNGTGRYAVHFKDLLSRVVTDVVALKEFLKEHDVTLAFEVIDCGFDLHPIVPKDKTPRLVLLDAIENTLEHTNTFRPSLDVVSKFLNLHTVTNGVRIDVAEVHKFSGSFKDVYSHLMGGNRSLRSEGYVITDANGFKVKIKGSYYAMCKSLLNWCLYKPTVTDTVQRFIKRYGCKDYELLTELVTNALFGFDKYGGKDCLEFRELLNDLVSNYLEA